MREAVPSYGDVSCGLLDEGAAHGRVVQHTFVKIWDREDFGL